MKKLILLISLSTLVLPSFGQRWKDYRQEVIGSVGPSFLLGDVGGGVDKPTNTIRDINFKATRVSLGGELPNYRHVLSYKVVVSTT